MSSYEYPVDQQIGYGCDDGGYQQWADQFNPQNNQVPDWKTAHQTLEPEALAILTFSQKMSRFFTLLKISVYSHCRPLEISLFYLNDSNKEVLLC